MAYDNNSNKTTFITRTGSQVITGDNGAYTIDVSTLIDSSSTLSAALTDSDEIVVVRKFDHSTIDDSDYTHSSAPITASEAWSAWTLPTSNSSGSTMYTLNASTGLITFSTTASDYTWTTAMSGRSADITVPVIASGDTFYVLRKTYNLSKLVTFTAGSRITAGNLNQSTEQLLFLIQEVLDMVQNLPKFNPSVGQPSGICPLDSSGKIASTYLGATVTPGNGLEGDGSSTTPLAIDLLNDSLAFSSGDLYVDTQDVLTSTSTTKPLSANQGKSLNDTITLIGTGIVYKGTFDLANTIASTGIGSPSAGWTIGHNGSSITSHSDWNSLSVTNGSVVRYNGTAWQVAQSSSSLLADGSIALNTAQKAVTQAANEGNKTDGEEKSVATVEYVEDAIVNTKLSELVDVDADVDDDTSDPAGQMLYWDHTGAWKKVDLNKTDNLGTDKVLSTGDGVSALDDVDTTAPTNGQVLVYTTAASLNKWKPATLSTEELMVTVGGTGDGAAGTDESDHVDNAFNDANLGHTGTPGSSTIAICDLRGRDFNIGNGAAITQDVEIPNRTGITIQNGALEYQLTDTAGTHMVDTPAAANSSSVSAAAVYGGETQIAVVSGSDFRAGDMVCLEAATDDDYAVVHDTSSIKMYGLQLVKLTKVDGNTLFFDEPLTMGASSGKITVKKYGTGTGGSQSQLKNLVLRNLRFTDRYGQKQYLADNGITGTYGATTTKVDFPASHGMLVGGKFRIYDADATDKTSASANINKLHTITGVSTNEITFDAGASWVAGSSTFTTGGNAAYVTINEHTGVNLKYGCDITIENCTFENWHEVGLQLERCKNVTIRNCVFNNCGNSDDGSGGINIIECDNVVIENCKFNSCFKAISVAKNATARPSKTLTVKDCVINCLEGIHISGGLSGRLTVCNNIIRATPLNSERIHLGITKASSDSNPGYCIQCETGSFVESVCITDNQMDGVRREPTVTWSSTAFWGEGDGNTHEKGNLTCPTAVIGISLRLTPNKYLDISGTDSIDDGGSDGTTRCIIRGNTIKSWLSGINIKCNYNATHADRQEYRGFEISNNTITEGLYGIQIDHVQSPSQNIQWLFRGAQISGNYIHNSHLFKEAPYHSTWTTVPPKGIWYNYGNGLRCYDHHIVHNTFTTSATTGQGIIFGNANNSAENIIFADLHISNNTVVKYANAVYFYRLKNDTDRATANYVVMVGNYFRNQEGQGVFNEGSITTSQGESTFVEAGNAGL